VGVSTSAEELFQPETLRLIDELQAETTPSDIVRTISRLRAAGHPQERIHHALEQVRLRRKGRAKFGEFSSQMLFTVDGLEQATRLSVAAHHAGRFRGAGIDSVADVGCGIGADAMAYASLGIRVLAVEKDPLTAAVASYNLSPFDNAEVLCGDGMSVDLSGCEGIWLDPARREGASRLHDPSDYSPRLDDAIALAQSCPGGIKLAPGMDRELIPENVEAQWVSDGGEVVEMVWWFGELKKKGISRSALVITDSGAHTMEAQADNPDAEVAELGQYLYEPDGAVIRARLIGDLVRSLEGGMIDPSIAYFTSATYRLTPFAQCFEVEQVLPAKIKELSRWVKEHEVGTLEIKKRGIDVDPAQLRRKLPLAGESSKTLILTRMAGKKVAIATHRVGTRV